MPLVQRLHPSQITEELKQQRASLDGVDKVRASPFNLFVIIQDPTQTDYVLELLDLVVHKFPCRICLLVEDPATSELIVDVKVVPIGEGDVRVTCDQIEFHYPPAMRDQVELIVLPHLHADLPTYAMWLGEPKAQGDFFPLIEPNIKRLIFSQDNLEHIKTFAKSIVDLASHYSGDIVDLKWAYTHGWRRVVAEAFNSEEKFALLETTKTLKITYAYREQTLDRDPRIQAVYLQSWLATKLGWTFKSLRQAGDQTIFDYDGVSVTLAPKLDTAQAFGAIDAIHHTSTGGHEALFERDLGGDYVTFKLFTPDRCDLPHTLYLPHPQHELVMEKKLFQEGTDPTFLEVLCRIAT